MLTRRRLRTPEERVGGLAKASLPPPESQAAAETAPAAAGEPAGSERAARAAAEEALLDRALRERDEQSLERALDLFHPIMLRLALARLHSRAAAEETIQETWLAALNGIGRFQGRSSLRTWLFRILRNLVLKRARRDARTVAFSSLENGAGSGGNFEPRELVWTAPAADPSERLLARELAAAIEAAIAELPVRQREVLVLRDVEGWDAAEVCATLRLSPGNQRVLLHRARDRVRLKLRNYLWDHGTCDDETG